MNIYCAACIILLAGAVQPDHEAVRNGLVARLEGLQRIAVKYDLERIPIPSKRELEMDGKDMGGGRKIQVVRDPVTWHEEFWYLDGRMRHEARLSAETQEYLRRTKSPYRPRIGSVDIYTRQKYETLSRLESCDRGGINNPMSQLRVDREIAFGLGLKSLMSTRWLAASDFDDARIESMSTGDIGVSREIGSGLHKWTYSPNLGYALESYEITKDGKVTWRLNCSDFKNIEGFMLPMKIESQAFEDEDGERIVIKTKHITVHEYSLNHPENTPDKYNIVWPSGAMVYDHRIGVTFEADDAGKLHPLTPIGDKEILDNLDKPLEQWPKAGDPNTSSSTPEAPEDVAGDAKQDQNDSPVHEEVSPPTAGTGDVDAGSGKTLTFVALALFLACAVSIAVYNAKQRKKATECAP